VTKQADDKTFVVDGIARSPGERRYVVTGADGRRSRIAGEEALREFKTSITQNVNNGLCPAELFQIDLVDENGDVVSSSEWQAGDGFAAVDAR
jgi:hypothetical protein